MIEESDFVCKHTERAEIMGRFALWCRQQKGLKDDWLRLLSWVAEEADEWAADERERIEVGSPDHLRQRARKYADQTKPTEGKVPN